LTIARERIELIKVLPLTIEGLGIEDIEPTGLIKAKHKISFADGCIAAMAKEKDAELVHKDPEYEAITLVKQKKLPYKK